jgi:ribonucleoside-triphosphate reductase
MIPKARFDKVNEDFKTIKKQLDDILSKQKADEEEAAKKRGEYEQLFNTARTEADTFKGQAEQHGSRVQQLEAMLGEMLTAKIEAVPEAMRDLIPDNLAPEAKLAWIEKAQAKGLFGKGKEPDVPVGGSTNPPPDSGTKPAAVLLKEAQDKARKTGRTEDFVAVAQLKRELGL